jgi:hypothetical protein
LGLPGAEVISETAKRVALAADIAADQGLGLFLEPLGWSPVCRVGQALRILDMPNSFRYLGRSEWRGWDRTACEILKQVLR